MTSNGYQLTTLETTIVKFLKAERIPVCFTAHISHRIGEPYKDVIAALQNLVGMGTASHFKVAGGDAWVLTKPRKGVKI